MSVRGYEAPSELTSAQRWGTYFCVLLTLGMIVMGFVLRGNILNATRRFESPEVGIAVRYPATWLIEQGTRPIIFRVTDPAAIPFKTTITVSVISRGATSSAEEVLRDLSLKRSSQIAPYKSLGIETIQLRNGTTARQQTYAYASVENNPFLQSEPIIVRAVDVIILRGSQAVVITFETDGQSFERNQHYFEAFLASLEF
ncbi:MAG: hypothetical protein KF716_09500 [Anaerolineae bacterium]|nr:hypothetical protein [Anaerolineae bacterium]